MVCRTSTPSDFSCSAATCSGSCPCATRPRLTQSLVLLSLTRELPIGLPPQQALVPVLVGDDLDLRRDLGVALDEPTDRGRQARRETACGQQGDTANRHGTTPSVDLLRMPEAWARPWRRRQAVGPGGRRHQRRRSSY